MYYDPGPVFVETPTPRQIDIMQAVVDGAFRIEEIAEALDISPHTVETHLHDLYGRLGTHNLHGTLVRMWQLGYITIERRAEP